MTPTDVLANTVISGELLALLPDLGPCELVEGRIVQMTPTRWRHGKVEQSLGRLLGNFLDAHPLGEVSVGEVGIYTRRDPDTVRGADVVLISHERLARTDPEAAFLTVAPELVIEIRSPDDRIGQVETKIQEYLEMGVLEVWIVDPENRTVRRHQPGPADSQLLDETSELTTPLLPEFRLNLNHLFR